MSLLRVPEVFKLELGSAKVRVRVLGFGVQDYGFRVQGIRLE